MKKLPKKIASKIANFFAKITKPVRSTRQWKWLRKYILRSPFRGYFAASWVELKHVTWPNRKTAWKLTGIVILFSLLFAVFTAALDYGFEKLAKQLFLS